MLKESLSTIRSPWKFLGYNGRASKIANTSTSLQLQMYACLENLSKTAPLLLWSMPPIPKILAYLSKLHQTWILAPRGGLQGTDLPTLIGLHIIQASQFTKILLKIKIREFLSYQCPTSQSLGATLAIKSVEEGKEPLKLLSFFLSVSSDHSFPSK